MTLLFVVACFFAGTALALALVSDDEDAGPDPGIVDVDDDQWIRQPVPDPIPAVLEALAT